MACTQHTCPGLHVPLPSCSVGCGGTGGAVQHTFGLLRVAFYSVDYDYAVVRWVPGFAASTWNSRCTHHALHCTLSYHWDEHSSHGGLLLPSPPLCHL